jgi:hypothetical protein
LAYRDLQDVQGGKANNDADILDVLRGNGRVSNLPKDPESTTMNKLHELNIKVGSARHKKYAESQRRIVNQ